jgi:glycine/D-amino acid oxidase-like deaminating enzyme
LPADLRRTILPGGEGAWDTRTVLSSLRLDAAGRLVFGSIGALRAPGHAIHRDWGRRALRRLFPALGDVDFEHEWYGWIGTTADSLPRFHRLARNVVSFSGYNGRGIGTGTVFGRELARLVRGEVAAGDLAFPQRAVIPVRWRPAREAFYDLGAQAAHVVDGRW